MIWDYLKSYLERNPYQVLVMGRTMITYKKLICDVEKLANKLGKRIYGILCDFELNYAKALLACFAAGKTAVVLSNRSEDTKKMVGMFQLKYVLTDENAEIHEVHVSEIYNTLNTSIKPKKCDFPIKETSLILCTSGSTGVKKGVKISETALLNQLEAIKSYYPLLNSDKVLISRGLYFCGTIIAELLYGLVCGAQIHLYQESRTEKIALYIKENDITVYTSTPTSLFYLCRSIKKLHTPITLRVCTSVGEAMTPVVLKKLQEVLPEVLLVNAYGMTESSGRIVYHIYRQKDRPDCIGKPICKTQMKIVTADGKIAVPGEEGELYIKGEMMMDGYYPTELFRKPFTPDGWFPTGDIVVADSEGFLYLRGRKDDMLIRDGKNVYPAEIEAVIQKHRNVKKVVVYANRENGLTDRIEAAVEVESQEYDSGQFIKELFELCRKELDSNKIPESIKVVDNLLSTDSGKVVRKSKCYEQ